MGLALHGSSAALEQVLTHYGRMVRAVGRRHGLEDADLEEALQDTRVRLWRALASSESVSAVSSSYVYQAARSAALDLVRRRRNGREESLDARGVEAAKVPTVPGPDERMERGELAERIGRALDTLGATRRPVVRMYLAGYGRDEIAGLMGWSEAKTRNLLYRGLSDLRDALTRLGIGPEGER